ncbi:MAG: DUF3320 domain-containing protein [Chloroflexi bacterium]|nr:DUF3320 domain-containing protein [Chloroflexota bacterium]
MPLKRPPKPAVPADNWCASSRPDAGSSRSCDQVSASTSQSDPAVPACGGGADSPAAQESPSQFDEYERFSHEGPAVDPFSVPLSDLDSLVQQIVKIEQPIHVAIVFERIDTALGTPRLESNVRMRLTSATQELVHGGAVALDSARFLRIACDDALVRPRCDGHRKIA